MPAPREPARLLEAARLYHIEGLSQAEIARQLGTSRSNVSRMLGDALRLGIVEVRLHDPTGRERQLEADLKEAFGLDDVRVARRTSRSDRLAPVGGLASQLLLSRLEDSMTVGLSWGLSVQATVYATRADHEYAANFVPLVGGLSSISNEASGQDLVREMADRLGGTYRYLHSPATFTSVAAQETMQREPSIADALAAARKADIAVVGIGVPTQGSSAAVLTSMGLEPWAMEQFWKADPAGDVLARYFDADGRPIEGEVNSHTLGLTLGELQQIPTVIGVAAGRAKTPGVLGALRGQIINVLACDESLAKALLAAVNTKENRR